MAGFCSGGWKGRGLGCLGCNFCRAHAAKLTQNGTEGCRAVEDWDVEANAYGEV